MQEWIKLFKFQAAKADAWTHFTVPKNRLRALAFRLVSHKNFDTFIMCVIIANVAVMAMDHWDAEPDFE